MLRESIRLAFIAALQHLPARQRAVLILREVLRWHASEVAELLGTTVQSVNSALQRARATLADSDVRAGDVADPMDEDQRALLARYVDAFERYDLDSLVALLHEDMTMSMPPYDLWLRGPDQLRAWFLGKGIGCRGRHWSRCRPTDPLPSPSTGPADREAASSHGRSRSSTSSTAGSPPSRASWTPACTRASGCRRHSTAERRRRAARHTWAVSERVSERANHQYGLAAHWCPLCPNDWQQSRDSMAHQ